MVFQANEAQGILLYQSPEHNNKIPKPKGKCLFTNKKNIPYHIMAALNHDIPFKKHACCILVKGSIRSTICDVQRNEIHLIPNILHDIISEYNGKTVNEIKERFNFEYDSILDEYFNFLFENEIIFNTKTPESFVDMEMQWNTPYPINNCIIDLDENTVLDCKAIAKSLDNIDCTTLEVRCFSNKSPEFLNNFLNSFKGTTVLTISIIVRHDPSVEFQKWEKLCDEHQRLVELTLHSSTVEQTKSSFKFLTPINLIKSKIDSELCCGKIKDQNFSALTESFTEGLKFNSCLNGKISIDRNGNIKNCPSLSKSIGNIRDITLEEAANNPELKEYWEISKDKISTCKDCEFRFVCTDCRAYIEDPNDKLSKPLKCGYDPYTCEWEDWAKNPIKKQAKDFYQL